MKSRLFLFVFCISVISCQTSNSEEQDSTEKPTYATIGSIERLDPALDAILPVGTEIQVLAEGFDWAEGPVWVPELEAILFSDIPPNNINIWKEGEAAKVFLHPSGYTGTEARGGEVGSNGLLLDPEGKLVLCQHGDRRVARMDAPWDAPAANYSTLVDNYQGKRLNSPNDADFNSKGDLYFTDPPYGLEKNMDDPSKELDFQGVYRLAAGNTEAELLTDQMTRPNGIAFSPDESTVYVANSDPQKAIWMAYDVQADGSLANGRVFFDATHWVGERKGLPDGLKVGEDGTIYATGPGGVLIFSPAGKHLGTIMTTEATANCGFGGDGYLYITADMYLLRVKLGA